MGQIFFPMRSLTLQEITTRPGRKGLGTIIAVMGFPRNPGFGAKPYL